MIISICIIFLILIIVWPPLAWVAVMFIIVFVRVKTFRPASSKDKAEAKSKWTYFDIGEERKEAQFDSKRTVKYSANAMSQGAFNDAEKRAMDSGKVLWIICLVCLVVVCVLIFFHP